MSVTEIAPRGEDFERTPPHDIAAERCVLGGMLLSKDAISDVIEVIRPQDHYRPAHQIVHEVILDLYARGEPADAVTIAAELTRRGEISRVGGADYLHTLIASVPTAANAGYYARIVRERAILRRLVEVGTRIVQLGYSGDGDADDLVDQAQAEVYAVTERRTSEDYLPLSEIMPGTLDEIEAIGGRGGGMSGVPTGFADLDALTNGLHAGQMIVIAARPALGKALALDTTLPTPAGWTTMGEVAVGDQLIGADGKPVNVVAATEVMHGRPCYEVEFDDGTVIIADARHLWRTETRDALVPASSPAAVTAAHKPAVSTEHIAATLTAGLDGQLNHSVATALPLQLPEADLPLSPYALGVWLARDAGVAADPTTQALLRRLGVLENKHIPAGYLRASEPQRRALLAGLLDTGGTPTRSGSVQFAVTSRRLAEDFRELVISLGHRSGWHEKPDPGRGAGTSVAYVVTFTTSDDVFRLSRARAIHQECRPRQPTPKTARRYIRAARRVHSRPVRCVQVDSADQLYLASRSMIPTHNSTLALDLARAATVKHGLTTVMFSLEMSRNEITMRLLAAEARVPLHTMRTGQLSDDDWTRLARRMSEVADAPLFIDDSPNLSMMEIRSKCRRLKQRHDLRMVIVDYLQLMTSPKRVENRQQEVSEMSRSLKLLAKELDVPVVAVSQLNRGPEQRTDKRPQLSDLRESGCLTAETRILRADTGVEVPLGELLASGERDIPVWSLDERLRLVPRTLTHAFSSGTKEVFRVRLASGRQVHATAGHPFLAYRGWLPLGELIPGSRVAVPRQVPGPLVPKEMPEPEVVILARLIGDSSSGLRSHEKSIPPCVFSLPKQQLALFLHHLWATDGSVTVGKAGAVRVQYGTTSERLARDVQILLLRFEIAARLRAAGNTRGHPQWTVDVVDAGDQRRFLEEIGVHGNQPALVRARKRLDDMTAAGRFDAIPAEVGQRVAEVGDQGLLTKALVQAGPGTGGRGDFTPSICPAQTRLGRISAILEDAELELLATSDVYWDTIASIESIGERPVYDATVLGTHNFVANGTSLHNSIEQDSDMVILLHREDAYERESPRAGEADLVVAKHRNGPTATVTVAFQGHYSRFVDMAPA